MAKEKTELEDLGRWVARNSLPSIPKDEFHKQVQRFQEGDVGCGERLVRSCYKMLFKEVRRFDRMKRHALDLFQEGCLGFIKSLERFDQSFNRPAFVVGRLWARSYMMNYLSNHSRVVRLPKTRNALAALGEIRELLQRGLCADAAIGLTQKRWPLFTKDQLYTILLGYGDNHVGSIEDEGIAEASTSTWALHEDASRHRRYSEWMDGLLGSLTERESLLLERLMSDEPKTLEALGVEMGVTRERVRQLEIKFLKRIRQLAAEDSELLEAYLDGEQLQENE